MLTWRISLYERVWAEYYDVNVKQTYPTRVLWKVLPDLSLPARNKYCAIAMSFTDVHRAVASSVSTCTHSQSGEYEAVCGTDSSISNGQMYLKLLNRSYRVTTEQGACLLAMKNQLTISSPLMTIKLLP